MPDAATAHTPKQRDGADALPCSRTPPYTPERRFREQPLVRGEHLKNMTTPAWLLAARDQWEYRGDKRPPFAIEPGPGQESVWDFPRPPALRCDRRIEVRRDGVVLARSQRGFAVCETAHPPTYYFPRDDVDVSLLRRAPGDSFCEWKGQARYHDVLGGPPLLGAAWSYQRPFPEFDALAGCIAFMPQSLECFVDGVRARPQGGGFYGGWITPGFVGPFKGDPGISG